MTKKTPLPHFVSQEPFDVHAVETLSADQEKYFAASQWQLMWWKLKRHKIAVAAGLILLVTYLMAIFAEVVTPYTAHERHTDYIFAPPQGIHLFHDGSFIGPFVYGMDYELNMENLQRVYTPNLTQVHPIQFFCSTGTPYEFWGLFEANFRLICPPAEEGAAMFLLGTDRLGRDIASRLVHGARISLTVGLLGIMVSFILGITIGGMAGYFGGRVDMVAQRAIEIFKSLPELPLWMALSAALPVSWSPLVVFLGITIILGLLDWPGLARAVRSKILSLREEEFCVASRFMGARPRWIIARHLLPNFSSHLIASMTLSIPGMILGETALSFLGLGLRAPVVSWGVLLTEAQNIEAVALYPWLMVPMLPVMITVLCFNFLGDGLRDAADPYS